MQHSVQDVALTCTDTWGIWACRGKGWVRGEPERDEGSSQTGLKLAPVHPASDRVGFIGGPPQHHGGTPVVLKQGPILAHESGVRAFEDLPGALGP